MGGYFEPGLPCGDPPRTPPYLCTVIAADYSLRSYIYIIHRKFTHRESNFISGFKREICRVPRVQSHGVARCCSFARPICGSERVLWPELRPWLSEAAPSRSRCFCSWCSACFRCPRGARSGTCWVMLSFMLSCGCCWPAIPCERAYPFVSFRISPTEAGCLHPKAGGGCVRAWIVCDAVRGADCRVQCFAAGRAIGGR